MKFERANVRHHEMIDIDVSIGRDEVSDCGDMGSRAPRITSPLEA